MIKNMVKVFLNGQMEDNMMVNGKMENNMVKVNISEQIKLKEKDIGKTEEELNGLM